MDEKRKRSLGRNVFDNKNTDRSKSDALRKIIEGKPRQGRSREIDVRVKLTPANLKHLDAIREALEKSGKGRFSRSELIRVAITLLSSGDF